MQKKRISIIVPVYNEEKNVPRLYKAIKEEWKKSMGRYDLELLFIDDGSRDRSMEIIKDIAKKDERVHFIEFSRNFGKEIATTAGIHACMGDACIMIDADLQHPVSLLPQFAQKWENGAEVVVGVRNASRSDSAIKKLGGTMFYTIMGLISTAPIIPHATDYRLIDRIVVDAFNTLPERNRMTRALIDWLGFRRETLYFDAAERAFGQASYSTYKLIRLAFTSIVSMSMFPLWTAGFLGVFIVICSGTLGVVMFLDRYVVSWGMSFSGTAILADITLFLVGIILVCMGFLAFYIGHIYRESQGRQMYIIRKKK